jgi:hypothetical protein
MPRPQPNSNMQILDAVTDRHVIPVKDIDRPELTNLHVSATAATGNLTGAGAPTNHVAGVAATLVRGSVAANSDLTFTAAQVGTVGNGYSVTIVQPVTLSSPLSVDFDGSEAIINLPTDGAGAPVAATATQVKAVWDASAYVPFPNAYPLTNYMTVVVEGTGAGAVDVAAEASLTGGADTIPGTGVGAAAKGTMYTNNTNGAIYVNTGTLEAPVWTINA